MKKKTLKEPIEKALLIINTVIFLIVACGIEDLLTKERMIYLFILLIVFSYNNIILYKHTSFFED